AQGSDLEQRALGRMAEIGQDSPEMHMVIGKAHINREEYDDAINELDLAAQNNTRLPFVHFYLGWAYLKKQEPDHAKTEFLKDIAIEHEVAYNYDQLGTINYLRQLDPEADKNLS